MRTAAISFTGSDDFSTVDGKDLFFQLWQKATPLVAIFLYQRDEWLASCRYLVSLRGGPSMTSANAVVQKLAPD
jgi:hypothetical protein